MFIISVQSLLFLVLCNSRIFNKESGCISYRLDSYIHVLAHNLLFPSSKDFNMRKTLKYLRFLISSLKFKGF